MEYKRPFISDEEGAELKKEFISIFEKEVLPQFTGADKLLEWINCSDFFESPASTQYHLACKYGLLKHSLNVYRRLLNLVNAEYGKEYEQYLGVNASEIALIALCHDLCKVNTYKVDTRNVKDENGNWVKEPYYKYSADFEMGGHGQKSLFIVQQFVTGLSLNVCSAIVYHMGASGSPNSPLKDDVAMKSMEDFPIILFTHMADMLATYCDEKREPK